MLVFGYNPIGAPRHGAFGTRIVVRIVFDLSDLSRGSHAVGDTDELFLRKLQAVAIPGKIIAQDSDEFIDDRVRYVDS